MSERRRCTCCNGSGSKTERVAQNCHSCGGAGRVYQSYDNSWQHCYSCGGSGARYESEVVQCNCCGGSGYAY